MNSKKLSLIALGLMALPTSSYAERQDVAPTMTISGEASGTYYAFKGSQREGNGGRGNGHAVQAEDTRINFDIFGETSSYGGLEYGYLIGISGNTQLRQNPVVENRIKLKGSWGTFFIGTHRGVDHIMPVGAFSTAGASGGVLGGSYKDVLTITTGTYPSIDMVGTVKDVNRVTYVTPRISGLQVGVSFAPLGHQKGESKPNSYLNPDAANVSFGRNITSLGLNYKTDIDNQTKLQLSAAGVFSKLEPGTARGVSQKFTYNNKTFDLSKTKRVASYTLGLLLSHQNVDLGFEFMDNGKSGVYSNIPGATAGKTFSVGLGYKSGIDRWSIGYLYNTKKLGNFGNNGYNPRAKVQACHLTWDRTLAPGLNLFAEANYFDMRTNETGYAKFFNAATSNNNNQAALGTQFVGNNHGQVLLSGVKVKF